MSDLRKDLENLLDKQINDFDQVVTEIESASTQNGYNIVEKNSTKPWGAYIRFDSSQADGFVNDFFPDLSPSDARLGIDGAELSPKFLLVKPEQRLSWQYHDRRAERWCFLSKGGYRKSIDDIEGKRHEAQPGEVVQFQTGERHRLEGISEGLVLVAEIWQHSDKDHASDEDDIIRLSDDYQR